MSPVPPDLFAQSRPRPDPETADLESVLQRRFRLQAFRPHQRAVCASVVDGKDCLLVMPTGGGKSLCYQLPALVRAGSALVISPLIALMEDQVAKLQALGLRAERIHSGRDRGDSQAVLRAWLAGDLDYLMIAPERLRVPGFAARLVQRRLSLIAVDEAHCISMWGHDFRPDYRLLGERLPELRGAAGDVPIVAMTATATVRVQQDIVQQLGIPQAERFIHGFRRENLAIEVAEATPSARVTRVVAALQDPELKPALVYVLSRRMVDEVVAALGSGMRCAGYHAGMPADRRARVQEDFQSGRLDVVVATVAFGMGIDKANIRAVFHLGMPGSIEGYYQEIGRAGRDGQPSHAIALYSWADRRLHELFFERGYPTPEAVLTLHAAVPAEGISRETLLSRCGLPLETAEAALDKLWGLGAVALDLDDSVRPHPAAPKAWIEQYRRQRVHREGQLDEVFGYARDAGCRMQALTAYFGDHADSQRPCGHCDHCRPESTRVRQSAPADAREQQYLLAIVQALRGGHGIAAGRLHRDNFEPALDRRAFERLVDGLERAGIVSVTQATFDKDGQSIRYKLLELAERAGPRDTAWLATVRLDLAVAAAPKARAAKAGKAPARKAAGSGAPPDVDGRLVSEIKAWRLARARLEGVPAFRILSDATLYNLVAALPRSRADLLEVHGVGPRLVEKYGDELLAEFNR